MVTVRNNRSRSAASARSAFILLSDPMRSARCWHSFSSAATLASPLTRKASAFFIFQLSDCSISVGAQIPDPIERAVHAVSTSAPLPHLVPPCQAPIFASRRAMPNQALPCSLCLQLAPHSLIKRSSRRDIASSWSVISFDALQLPSLTLPNSFSTSSHPQLR